jgi:hypothetical protein
VSKRGRGEEDGGSAHEDRKWVRYLDGLGPDFVGVASTGVGVETGDRDGDTGTLRLALASSFIND